MSNPKYKAAIILMVLALVVPAFWQESLAGHAQGIEIAPTPLPTPTPGPDGNTYQSPYGWSISWSDDWTATSSNERNTWFDGWTDDTLYLTQEAYPDLTVEVRSRGGKQFFCQDAVFGIPAAISVDGSYLKHQGGEYHNWVVYMEEFPSELADEPDDVIATYYECRRNAEPVQNSSMATYVEFEATAPIDTYQAVADSIQILTGNLRPEPENLIPPPTPVPTADIYLDATERLDGGTYTDPIFGWSISWSPDDYRSMLIGGAERSRNTLLLNKNSPAVSVTIQDYYLDPQTQVDTGVEACLQDFTTPYLESNYQDVSDRVDASRFPQFSQDYAYMVTEKAGYSAGFDMCIDLGDEQHFLYLKMGVPLNRGASTDDLINTVYDLLWTLAIP